MSVAIRPDSISSRSASGGALTEAAQLHEALHELRKGQEALRLEIAQLRQQQEGFSDASRMLVEAIMTWAQTEPAQMWRETQRWLREIQGMSEQITKRYFTDEAQRLLISKVVEESVYQINELMSEYRERISQRATRAIASMDSAFHTKLDDMGESAAEQYAQILEQMHAKVEQAIEKTALDQKAILEALANRILRERGDSS
jgi:hypothetical protein